MILTYAFEFTIIQKLQITNLERKFKIKPLSRSILEKKSTFESIILRQMFF